MVEVPTEIWHLVASYLPDDVLRKLSIVNRAFYDMSMGARHRVLEVSLYRLNLAKLERLRQHSLNVYVRTLKIDVGPREGRLVNDESALRASLASVLETISILDCVEELAVSFPGMGTQATKDFLSEAIESFFASMWKCVAGSRIKRLHLRTDVTLTTAGLTLPPQHIFSGLKELHVTLFEQYSRLTVRKSLLAELMVPFLNSLSPQLRTLTIRSLGAEDIWQIFQESNQFTLLEKLELHLLSSYPSDRLYPSLKNFFSKQCANITSLTLRCQINGAEAETSERLLTLCLSDELACRNLRVLRFVPSVLDLQAVQSLLSRCQDVLEEFSFSPKCTVDEILPLICSLRNCSRLSTLTLWVREISDARIFDALSTIPSLRCLSLHRERHIDEFMVPAEMAALQACFESRLYAHWNLQDIGIRYYNTPATLGAMKAIARSIPSVKSFWGQGNMEDVPSLLKT